MTGSMREGVDVWGMMVGAGVVRGSFCWFLSSFGRGVGMEVGNMVGSVVSLCFAVSELLQLMELASAHPSISKMQAKISVASLSQELQSQSV
jgi:hypothetical protein